MAYVTAKQLSEVIGVGIDKLLDQLNAAGVEVKDSDDPISDEDKMKLLESLRSSHGKEDADGPKKITLRRKSKSELRVAGTSGRNAPKRRRSCCARPGSPWSSQRRAICVAARPAPTTCCSRKSRRN